MFKYILPNIIPFKNSAEKYGTNREATDGNIKRRMPFAYWITKATNIY
jgi:hypothetical protein